MRNARYVITAVLVHAIEHVAVAVGVERESIAAALEVKLPAGSRSSRHLT